MKSWKTTLCGILGIVAAGITLVVQPMLDGDASTSPNWTAFLTGAVAAVGLLFARDADKSSEDMGIK